MSVLDDYRLATTQLMHQYEHGELTYNQANVALDEESDALLRNYLIDTPDVVLETTFESYADLQVSASQMQDITQSEASNLIYTRAADIFDKSKAPEEIDALCKPYEAAIFGEEVEDTPEHDGMDDDDGQWFGPFSLN